jgi:hypothetical protein
MRRALTVNKDDMTARPGTWACVLVLLGALAIVCGAREALAETDGLLSNVTLHRLGEPCFQPVDFRLFSANVEDFFGLLTGPNGILPEPQHRFHPELGVGPGEPHDPPYDTEIRAGLARLGLADQQRFAPEDFSLPNAILFAFMVVPVDQAGCPRGSSPDFREGPIIPHVLFPTAPEPDSVLVSRTTFFHSGQVFDSAFILDVRRLDKITPPIPVDGHSHIPVFLATAAEFGPGGGIAGPYTVHSVLVDHAGNGWDITTRFEIR